MVTASTILVIIALALTGKWSIVAKKLERLRVDWGPFATLVGCCLVLFLLRLPLAFEHYAFTPDMASYLTTRNYVLGTDYGWPPGLHTRPPLIGVLLVPVTFLFGDLWGSKLLALAFGVGLAVPIYVFARHWLRPWWALAAALIAVIQPYTAMYTIGGYLPMVALFFALFALRALLDRSYWAIFAAFMMAGFNGTIIPIYALAGFAFVAPNRKGVLILALSGVAMLPWLYWFLQMGDAPVFPGPLFSISQFPETLWYAAAVVCALPFFLASPRLRRLGVLCVIFAIASNIQSAHNTFTAILWRTHYMVPVLLVVGSMYFASRCMDWARQWHTAKRFHATGTP